MEEQLLIAVRVKDLATKILDRIGAKAASLGLEAGGGFDKASAAGARFSGQAAAAASAFDQLVDRISGSDLPRASRSFEELAKDVERVAVEFTELSRRVAGGGGLERSAGRARAAFGGIRREVGEFSRALTGAFSAADRFSDRIAIGFTTVSRRLGDAIRQTNELRRRTRDQLRELSDNLSGVGRGLRAGAVALGIAVGGIAEASRRLVLASGDFDESVSAFRVSFGDDAREAATELDGLVDSIGRGRKELVDSATAFQSFLVPLGLTRDSASEFSVALTELAGDIAAFRDITNEAAVEKLFSSLAGETEAARRIGIDLSEAALQQELYNLQINKSVQQATQQEKVLARLSAIFSDSADSIGQAARESDSFNGVLRRISGTAENAAIDIGARLRRSVVELIEDFGGVDRVVASVRTAFAVFGVIAEAVLERVGKGVIAFSDALANVDLDDLRRILSTEIPDAFDLALDVTAKLIQTKLANAFDAALSFAQETVIQFGALIASTLSQALDSIGLRDAAANVRRDLERMEQGLDKLLIDLSTRASERDRELEDFIARSLESLGAAEEAGITIAGAVADAEAQTGQVGREQAEDTISFIRDLALRTSNEIGGTSIQIAEASTAGLEILRERIEDEFERIDKAADRAVARSRGRVFQLSGLDEAELELQLFGESLEALVDRGLAPIRVQEQTGISEFVAEAEAELAKITTAVDQAKASIEGQTIKAPAVDVAGLQSSVDELDRIRASIDGVGEIGSAEAPPLRLSAFLESVREFSRARFRLLEDAGEIPQGLANAIDPIPALTALDGLATSVRGALGDILDNVPTFRFSEVETSDFDRSVDEVESRLSELRGFVGDEIQAPPIDISAIRDSAEAMKSEFGGAVREIDDLVETLDRVSIDGVIDDAELIDISRAVRAAQIAFEEMILVVSGPEFDEAIKGYRDQIEELRKKVPELTGEFIEFSGLLERAASDGALTRTEIAELADAFAELEGRAAKANEVLSDQDFGAGFSFALDQIGKQVSDFEIGVATTETAVRGLSSGLVDTFVQIIDGSARAGDAFKRFASDLLREIGKVIAEALLLQGILKALGFITNLVSNVGSGTNSLAGGGQGGNSGLPSGLGNETNIQFGTAGSGGPGFGVGFGGSGFGQGGLGGFGSGQQSSGQGGGGDGTITVNLQPIIQVPIQVDALDSQSFRQRLAAENRLIEDTVSRAVERGTNNALATAIVEATTRVR